MNLSQKTKKICDLYNISPQKNKGQNFLIEKKFYDEMIEAVNIKCDDVILEVGPGLGFLTCQLAQKAKKVITVELDENLAEVLRSNFKLWDINNVEIRNENVLDFCSKEIKGDYKIAANLPYNISSVFLRKFLSLVDNSPLEMVLMLQKELVQRIAASPPKMSLLGISVQYYADVKIISYVPKDSFWPAPKVDSGIIRIVLKNKNRDKKYEKEFFRLVKMGFSSKRKMLKNNLGAGLKIKTKDAEELLKKADIGEKARAQDLSIDNWRKLLGFVSF